MAQNGRRGSTGAADAAATEKVLSSEPFRKAVEQLVLDYGARAGLVSADAPRIGGSLLEERIYEVIRSKRVEKIQPPDDRDDRHGPQTSSSKVELTMAVFTDGPSPHDADQDLLLRAVFNRCQHMIWNLTQTGERGVVQRLLQDDGLILVRGSVFRDGVEVKDGIYVTTRPELIVSDFLGPHLDRLRNLAESLADDFQLLEERLPPATTAKVKRELEKKLEKIWHDLEGLGVQP